MPPVLLLCGLGNKGREYAHTRHNIGYLVVDRFSERYHIPLTRKSGGCRVGIDSGVILAKPDTYMNLSGGPVSTLMKKMGIKPDDLILIHDDLDMPFGRIRIKWGGRDGGHRGVRSVIEALGSPFFHRLKVGIGRNPSMQAEDYVLEPFADQEVRDLPDVLDIAAEALNVFVQDGSARAMSIYNKSPGI